MQPAGAGNQQATFPHRVVTVEAPVALGQFNVNLVVPEVALMDAGIAWIVSLMRGTVSRLSSPSGR